MPAESSAFWEDPEVVERFAGREPDERLAQLLDAEPDPAALAALDLGCAGGRNAELLAARGCDVRALDASRAMVARTRERLAPILGADEARRRVRRGAMDDLGWAADGAFDLVVALGIYHAAQSLGEWRRALAETTRVLAPGGRLLVAVFTPATDLTGGGITPVAGAPHLYEGFPDDRRAVLMEAATLDAEIAAFGFVPIAASRTVLRRLEVGRRVTVNALYRKRADTA